MTDDEAWKLVTGELQGERPEVPALPWPEDLTAVPRPWVNTDITYGRIKRPGDE